MQFQDELAGGIVLIRPALQSPEFQAGTSGWHIDIDGSAEFNDVVIRSTLESDNYVPGTSGWHLGQDGHAEFNDVTIRSTLQSTNYAAGSAGWQLDQAGHAEFNDVTIRGGQSLGGEAFYYDGTPGPGTLVLSIAAAAGTDPYGNAYPDGLAVYGPTGTVNLNTATSALWTNNAGSQIRIVAGGAQVLQQLQPPDVVGVTWDNASLGTNVDSTLGADTPSLFLQSPGTHDNYDSSSIRLYGSSPGTMASQIDLIADTVRLIGGLDVTGDVTAANLLSGIASTAAPGAGGGVTSTSVVFATPMSSVPSVSLDPVSGADPGGTVIRAYVDNLTATGFTIRAYRSSNSATNWAWIAHA